MWSVRPFNPRCGDVGDGRVAEGIVPRLRAMLEGAARLIPRFCAEKTCGLVRDIPIPPEKRGPPPEKCGTPPPKRPPKPPPLPPPEWPPLKSPLPNPPPPPP